MMPEMDDGTTESGAKERNGLSEDELRALSAGWPRVSHALKWEVDLVCSVANRMFAVLSTLGPDRGRLSFRVEPERFVELSQRSGMAPAPYAGNPFWIRVVKPEAFTSAELAAFVRRSYELVRASLSKQLQAGLDD